MPAEYLGINTKKAIKNFPFNFRKTPTEFMRTVALIKKASAIAHHKVGELDNLKKQAIVRAAEEVIGGKFNEQLMLPAFQGGAGTSNHMNVNEVIGIRATEILEKKGKKLSVHPNDHVNMSQSTNDVMPSALRITALQMTKGLISSLDLLIKELEKKSKEYAGIHKLGRTHMQDAVPVSLGSEFLAFTDTLRKAKHRILVASEVLYDLNLGGSAVGNSINVSPKYIKALYIELSKLTKLNLRPGKNLMAMTSSTTDLLAFSHSLLAACVDLSKLANDLRLLSSGPKGGLGEISLPELQAGSSIMPGKVNPVLPEAINQMYFLVSGNVLTIEHASQGAQLQLNVMLPVMTDRLIETIRLMTELIPQFAEKCVRGIKANKKQCKENLERSTAYATLLSPKLGYDTVSRLVKEAVAKNKTIRQIALEQKLVTNAEFDKLVSSFLGHNL